MSSAKNDLTRQDIYDLLAENNNILRAIHRELVVIADDIRKIKINTS